MVINVSYQGRVFEDGVRSSCISLFVYLCISPNACVCLSVCLFLRLHVSLCVCLSVCASFRPSIFRPSVCLSAHLSLNSLTQKSEDSLSVSLSDLESLSPSVSLIHITCTCTQLSFFTFKVVVPRRIQLNIKLMDGCNFRPILCHSLALFILEKKRKCRYSQWKTFYLFIAKWIHQILAIYFWLNAARSNSSNVGGRWITYLTADHSGKTCRCCRSKC